MNYNQCKAQGGKWVKDRCKFPKKTKSSVSPPLKFTKIIMVIILVIMLGFSSLMLTNIGTILHEFAGHTLVAKLLGCDAEWHTNTFTGQVNFENCALMETTDKTCDFDFSCDDGKTSTNDRCINGVCVHENKAINILIALAAIFVVFFVALGIWVFLHKDSVWRVLAIIIMLYSCIPSAFPLLQGSDMAYAVAQGFPILFAWGIYLIMSGTFMWLLINEVADRQMFKRWLN